MPYRAPALPALLFAACTALAQEEPAPRDVIVVTAGRAEEFAAAAPQSISVVTQEAIERESPQVLTDLLRGQPGVFTQSSGPGQGVAIIRGLKGSEVLHLVDGMRLNMAFFRNAPNQYVALVDPYNVRQIELLRGPGSVLYGSDALGGVVQVLTPEERFNGAGLSTRASQLVQFDSASLGRTSRSQAAIGNEHFSLAGGFTYADYGGQDTGGGGREPYTGFHTRAADAKLLWALGGGQELMISGQMFEVPRLPRYFEIVGGPGGPPSNGGLPVFFDPARRRFVHVRYRNVDAPGAVGAFELHLGRQVIDDDRLRFVNSLDTQETEQNRSSLSGVTAQARSEVEALRLVYGLEWYRDEVSSARQRIDLPTGTRVERAPAFPDGSRSDSAGAYLNAEWGSGAAWLIDAGLRFSGVRTDLAATVVSEAAEVDDADFTAHLGSLLKLRPGLAWTLNLARGFRAPNLFDLGVLGPRPNSDQVNVPNPALRPETLHSIDTGFKWHRQGLKAEWVIFLTDYQDRIEPREFTGNSIAEGELGCTTAGGCREVQSRNISRARYVGIESGLVWTPRTDVELQASLNWTRGEERRPGQATTPANRVPPLSGRVAAQYRPSTWFVEPYALFAAAQHRLDDDDRNDVRIAPDGTPGWLTLNARWGWMPTRSMDLQVDVENLLDANYREHGSGIDAPGRGVTMRLCIRI